MLIIWVYWNDVYMRYKVKVAYDGSNYKGWQKQKNSNSIQEVLEEALAKMCKDNIVIVGSGRTDSLVHACGQIFHFDCDKVITCEKYRMGLNSILPKDIRIMQVEKVSGDFHARFHCSKKKYDYYLTNEIDNPFYENYMGKVRKKIDVAKMAKCSDIFIGTHDFTSFSSNRINQKKSRIKTITKLEIKEYEHYVQFSFEGDGFLRYMVRMIVGTLIEVGVGNISRSDVANMLKQRNKEVCRYKADGQGLYLMGVEYKEIDDAEN